MRRPGHRLPGPRHGYPCLRRWRAEGAVGRGDLGDQAAGVRRHAHPPVGADRAPGGPGTRGERRRARLPGRLAAPAESPLSPSPATGRPIEDAEQLLAPVSPSDIRQLIQNLGQDALTSQRSQKSKRSDWRWTRRRHILTKVE
jgi:hypothetical protein